MITSKSMMTLKKGLDCLNSVLIPLANALKFCTGHILFSLASYDTAISPFSHLEKLMLQKKKTQKNRGKSSSCKGQQEHTVEMDVGNRPMNTLESLPFPTWNGIHTWKIDESALLGGLIANY